MHESDPAVQPRGVKLRVRQNVTNQPVIRHKLLDVYRRQERRKRRERRKRGKRKEGREGKKQKRFRAGTSSWEAVSLSFLSW